MLIIRCSKCKEKIFRYRKIGKGKVLRCYKERIIKDYSIKEGIHVLCNKCKNVIGLDEGNLIKMKQNSFYHTGSKQ
jgi:hypothetical protein